MGEQPGTQQRWSGGGVCLLFYLGEVNHAPKTTPTSSDKVSCFRQDTVDVAVAEALAVLAVVPVLATRA